MKQLFLFVFSIAMLNLTAQNKINEDSEINSVTVFLNGAEINRSASVNLKAGENLVVFSGLAQSVNSKSVNVKGNTNYLIKSVKHEADFEKSNGQNAELEALESELDEIEFSIKTRQSLQRVYKEEKSLLIANKSIKGSSEILLAEDLKEMAAFYRSHLEELEYKLLEIQLEIENLNETRYKLENQILASRKGTNKYSSKIEISIIAERNFTAQVDFSYVVNNASWYATYDVRTADVNEPVKLVYKANISQTTGIDWKDVQLTLSTGNPMVTGNKPKLDTWFLTEYNASKTYGWYKDNKARQRTQNQDPNFKPAGDFNNNGDITSKDLNGFLSVFGESSGISNTSLITAPIDALVNTEFPVSINYDVPSDGQSYEVEVQRNDLTSSFSYYAAPGVDKDAFLLTRLTNWSSLNLLPGDAGIYFQGSYVGNSFLDPYSTEDTLDISLGKDKNIIISREKQEEYSKTSTFGGNKKTTRAFKIMVKNNKNTAITLKLEDQIPVSKQDNISVETLEIGGALLDEKTGILSWEITLQPGETKEFNFSYFVKYPKKMTLARL